MFDAPCLSGPLQLEEEWIDYNGHLNMAYYNVLFDRGLEQVWEKLGFDYTYRRETGCTTFSAEFHVCYLREIHLGDTVRVSTHLLDYTEKSFHFYQELIYQSGWVSATAEGVSLHIDQSGPLVTNLPNEILANFKVLHRAHQHLPRPERVGRVMSLRG
ncbi:thioesterase family protein [Pseudopelagicola sp. nBUS_19]|uniref:thioesterase family protein n=1 Tax=Pseudopelagicola sp. nBUS_19 TaxID=3395316 RepID=UPI003EBDEBB0